MNQPTHRVLLVGEHLDARWIDAPAGVSAHRVMKPMALEYKNLPPESAGAGIPMPEFVDYRIERMPIAIRRARADIWIGVSTTLHGPDRDLAIVRAIFQRDVAQQFQEAW